MINVMEYMSLIVNRCNQERCEFITKQFHDMNANVFCIGYFEFKKFTQESY